MHVIAMDQHIPRRSRKSRVERDEARQRDGRALVANRVLTLATLIRRSATLRYRRLLGLSQLDWSILAMVGQHAPLSLNHLAGLISLDRGQLSRGISSLVKRGILGRSPSARGGREIEIVLSAKGRALFARLMREAAARNEALLSGLDAQDAEVLFQALERLRLNARAMLEQAQRPPGGTKDSQGARLNAPRTRAART